MAASTTRVSLFLRTLVILLALESIPFAPRHVLAQTTPAENPTFSLEGTVVDRKAQPVANAHVEIRDLRADDVLADTETDADGKFLILDVPLAQGQYSIRASHVGYRDDDKELTISVSASRNQELSFVLVPAAVTRGLKPQPFTVVPVFYATDRQETTSDRLGVIYANAGSPDRKLKFGTCEVSIPDTHQKGAIEQPTFWRLEFHQDPDKHVVLQKVRPGSKEVFLEQIRTQVASSKTKDAFVFIHGYNVSFEEAAQRTAQLAYDLRFQGAPIFYSWPSKARLFGYRDDEETIGTTVQNLREFLSDLTQVTGATQIHLVAHSMGNRALLAALQQLEQEASFRNASKFRQVVIAAPDVDRDLFIELAKDLAKPVHRLTLYVSSGDQALMLAHRVFHAQPRAGEADKPIVLAGVDTIDVNGVSTDLLGHSYYGDSKSVISDMTSVFDGEPPPRPGLSKVSSGALAYWMLTAVK